VSASLAVGILAAAMVVVIALLVANANRRRRRAEDVPPAMRPGYSDEQLERTVLERYMQWGLVLTVGLALFIPVYGVLEERRLNQEGQEFFVDAVVRGEEVYQENCAECHSANLAGGAAPSPYGAGESWPAPPLNNIVARYAENPNITDVRHFIEETLHQGRPGTPMPTWGAAFGGPMTDQQISDITSYILANQVEEVAEAQAAANVSGEQLFAENCVKCHGAELNGLAEDGTPRPGPSLIGVFERHSRDTILGILNNGIYLPTGVVMPPFGEGGYMYSEAHYTEDALNRIIDYLESQQPAALPEGVEGYQTPGTGPPGGQSEAPTQTAAATSNRVLR
jgi:mono/diheme cytochrome c family protein